MLVAKIAPVFLLALLVRAEKKIELQDIEEDNLKSEKEKTTESTDSTISSAPSFFKSDLFRIYDDPIQNQPRYVQQYAVTEQPEKPVPKPQYTAGPITQQGMVGYFSNVPMQIYLVPPHLNHPNEPISTQSPSYQYATVMPRIRTYTAPKSTTTQTNYIEVPAYVTPTGKAYDYSYNQPLVYVTYSAQTTATPHMSFVSAATAPGATHLVQYPTGLAALSSYPKYYDSNSIDENQENEIESPKQYEAQTEAPSYAQNPEYPRYYSSRAPLREEHRQGFVQELPPPNPLLFRGSPPHLAHIPKVLPMLRPLKQQVYASGAGLTSNAIAGRPSDSYGFPYRKRPSSLLESYIPSGVQLEYLKRGYTRDASALYETLSNNRHFNPVMPKQYERGFLPNQMYHTAAGGVTFGHYKRMTKPEKTNHT